MTFAKSLNPDQAWQNVGPDLDPNYLTSHMVFLQEFFEKDEQKAYKNFLGGNELMLLCFFTGV